MTRKFCNACEKSGERVGNSQGRITHFGKRGGFAVNHVCDLWICAPINRKRHGTGPLTSISRDNTKNNNKFTVIIYYVVWDLSCLIRRHLGR